MATRVSPPIELLLHIQLAASTTPERFESYLCGEPSVTQAWQTAGDIDFELHVVCDNLDDVQALLHRIRHDGGAVHTTSHMILRGATPARR